MRYQIPYYLISETTIANRATASTKASKIIAEACNLPINSGLTCHTLKRRSTNLTNTDTGSNGR